MVTVKRITIGLALAAALATAVSAQGWDYFSRYVIVATPAYRPCGITGLLGTAQPVVWNNDMWLFYTCGDGQVVAQHFTWSPTPPPVPVLQPPSPVASPCPGAFVAGQYGGCVPADHPLAKR